MNICKLIGKAYLTCLQNSSFDKKSAVFLIGIKSSKWITLSSLFLLSSCATTELFTPVDFCERELPSGMSRITVYRDTGFAGGGVPYYIEDTGQSIGGVAHGDTICWDRHPGTVLLTVKSKWGQILCTRTIDVKEGIDRKLKLEQTFHFFRKWDVYLNDFPEK